MTTMKNVMLRSEETHSGMKGFICVGTTHVYGEEITCRGRVSTILYPEETHSGMKGFICVGTTHVYGEEITCRGGVSTFIVH